MVNFRAIGHRDHYLHKRNDGADEITLVGYRAADQGSDEDFNAILRSLEACTRSEGARR